MKERGFTLIELLVVMSMMAMITAAGSVALRHYYRVRALQSAQGIVVAELYRVQQRSMSESYPNIYGVRFTKGSTAWAVVRLDAKTGTCSVVTSMTLEDGVTVSNDAGTQFQSVVGSTACAGASPGGSSANVTAFFYPSGTAVAGSVELESETIGSSRTLSVSRLTGRVSAP